MSHSEPNDGVIICPLCEEQVDELHYDVHEAADLIVLDWIRRRHPGWVLDNGACPRCLELYREMKASGEETDKESRERGERGR